MYRIDLLRPVGLMGIGQSRCGSGRLAGNRDLASDVDAAWRMLGWWMAKRKVHSALADGGWAGQRPARRLAWHGDARRVAEDGVWGLVKVGVTDIRNDWLRVNRRPRPAPRRGKGPMETMGPFPVPMIQLVTSDLRRRGPRCRPRPTRRGCL